MRYSVEEKLITMYKSEQTMIRRDDQNGRMEMENRKMKIV